MPKIGLEEKSIGQNGIKSLSVPDSHANTHMQPVSAKRFAALVDGHHTKRDEALPSDEHTPSDDEHVTSHPGDVSQADDTAKKAVQKGDIAAHGPQEAPSGGEGDARDGEAQLAQAVAAQKAHIEETQNDASITRPQSDATSSPTDAQKEKSRAANLSQDWSLAALLQLHQLVRQGEGRPVGQDSSPALEKNDRHVGGISEGSATASPIGAVEETISSSTATATSLPAMIGQALTQQSHIAAAQAHLGHDVPKGEDAKQESHALQNLSTLAVKLDTAQKLTNRAGGAPQPYMPSQMGLSAISVNVLNVQQGHVADAVKEGVSRAEDPLKNDGLNILSRGDSRFGATLVMSSQNAAHQSFKDEHSQGGEASAQEDDAAPIEDVSGGAALSTSVIGGQAFSFASLVSHEVGHMQGGDANMPHPSTSLEITSHSRGDGAEGAASVLTTGKAATGRASMLNMTVLTQDETAVRVQMVHSTEGLSALSLQGADESTTSVLQKSRRDLAHQLDSVGVKVDNMKIDVLPADQSGMAGGQGGASANSHSFQRGGEAQAGMSFGGAQTGAGGHGGQQAYPQFQKQAEHAFEQGQTQAALAAAMSEDDLSLTEGAAPLHLPQEPFLTGGGLNISV